MEMSKPPSKTWPRNIYIAVVPFRKQISLNDSNKIILATIAKKEGFERLNIDKASLMVNKSNLQIKDANLNKLVKFKAFEEYMFWTENYELYTSSTSDNINYSKKILIQDNVLDFDTIRFLNQNLIIVAANNGLYIYSIENNDYKLLISNEQINNLQFVDAVVDSKDILHLAICSSTDVYNNQISYMTYNGSLVTLKGSTKIKSLSDDFKINGISIGIDLSNTYIFYEQHKWNNRGSMSKTFMSHFKNDSNSINLDFNPIEYKSINKETNISDIRCQKNQKGELHTVFTVQESDTFSIVDATLQDGAITNITKCTKDEGWIGNTTLFDKDGIATLSYLAVAPEFNYEVAITSTDSVFFSESNRLKKDDYINAMLESIPPYFAGLIVVLLRIVVFIPAYIWIAYTDMTRNKIINKYKKFSYFVGLIIYTGIKYYTVLQYYTETKFIRLPFVLRFDGAIHIYLFLFIVISTIITYVLSDSKKSFDMLSRFFVFSVIDIFMTTFTYIPYIS